MSEQQKQSFLDRALSCNFFSACFKYNPCLVPDNSNSELSAYLSKFREKSHYDDLYFGEVYLLELLTDRQFVVLKREKHLSKDACENSYNRHLQRKALQSEHIINLLYMDMRRAEGFLFTNFNVYLIYDYILIDLFHEFENRIRQHKPYEEHEIMLIVTQSVAGLAFLESRNVSHGAVRPQHIYISNRRKIKVGYKDLFSYESNYTAVQKGSKIPHIYLSPEEVLDLSRGEPNPTTSQWKSSAYSFGMIILSMMHGNHVDSIYDYYNNKISKPKIDEIIKRSRGKFSERLVSTVSSLLQEQSRRPTFTKLTEKFISTSDREMEVTLLKDNPARDSYIPYYVLQKPAKVDPSQHKNYIAQLLYPSTSLANAEVYSRNTTAASNLENSLSGMFSVPLNNRVTYINGSKFDGEQTVGNSSELIRNGKGKYQMKDGQFYMGDWKNNKMHGYGLLYWSEGQIRYEGRFQNDEFHGKGTEYPKYPPVNEVNYENIQMEGTWKKYEGTYERDKKEGQGMITFLNGWWEGNFKNDLPDGEGVWHYSDPSRPKVTGLWRQGKQVNWQPTISSTRNL